MTTTGSNTLVSVIVPCYNYGRFMKECLNSVLQQTWQNWECIVIDNGSTDNSSEVATAFAAQDPRFRCHRTPQSGVAAARNLAVQLSKGSYILPLDADDKIATTYIEKAVAVLDKNRAVKVVYSDAELFGAASGRWALPPYTLKDLLIENSIFCTALYRKADFEAAGGYNEDMKEGFEDWDFWIRMLKSGGEVFKIPETLFYYRIRSESRNNSLDREKQLRLRRQIVSNHNALYQAQFALPDLIFEYYTAKKELTTIRNSRNFKLGTALLKPLQRALTLFKGKQA